MTAGGSGRVVCVALSPALDITYVSERFVAGEANRVTQVHAQAGGKAVNVARLLRQAGHDVVVTGFAGGLVGDEIVGHLDRWAVPHSLVRCAAGSRRTVSAFSTGDATATAYNESGPPIAAAEWERFASGFARLIHGAAGVVLSGSLPAGVSADAYRTLAGLAADAGSPAFVDAHAAPLLAAIAAKPALVKPNEHELAQAAGLAVPVPLPAAAHAARQFLADGAQGVIVSLGPRGLLGVLPGMSLLAAPPVQRGNPVGAGDAALAALVHGHLACQPWPDRLRRAAAMSAAALRQPVAGVVHADDVAELEALITVSEL
ncbi:MAG: 1-phosphofructokinase family hexose kinase [Trebonia sp.]